MAGENGRALEPFSVEAPVISPYHSLPNSAEDLRVNGPANRLAISRFPALSEENKKSLVQAMYLSIAAILGMFLRIVMAQFFGEECANPGTVGWLAASSPLCVTKDGKSVREGGIVFADLPANLLGAFLMGMMQPGSSLDLPFDVKVAWVSPSSFFQNWDIIHLAIMTGFCGSLTTFSSWNSEMVVMIFGTGDVKSQVVSAIFGYIIGMETALGSYVFGKTIATFIHRWRNPLSAQEADATRQRKEEGVHIDSELPEFERRYLPDLQMDHQVHTVDGVAYLERWRRSTYGVRRVNHELLPGLREIETAMLVNEQQFSPQAEGMARNAGWDLEALSAWVKLNPRAVAATPSTSIIFTVPFATILFGLIATALVLGLIFVDDGNAYSVTYRTMIYAGCFAPFGALLRWNLSGLNGKLKGDLSWIPAGTLTANVSGSVISIAMNALELRGAASGFWRVGTMRAIKVGFCGCLTTVSTFVSEVNKMMKKPNQFQAYQYIVMSLMTSSLLGCAVYAWIVYD